MANIKDPARISAKWKRVASGATTEYTEGIKNPRADWADETARAEGNYEQGVTAAINRKAFGKGVRNAGTQTWQRNAIAKGPARYASGVGLAEERYRTGFQPYAETIAALTLPDRGPKGDPKNIERVRVISEALHKRKIELEGS